MAKQITLKTSKKVVPMIYAYTTPEIKRHDGWTKIGYTEQDVDVRIGQQTHTADIEYKLEWKGTAIFDDGSGDTFHDKDFHAYLLKSGVKNDTTKDNEWFKISGPASHVMFYDFKQNRGVIEDKSDLVPYMLRNEQNEAIVMAENYFQETENGEFLWNAKPRFGKTLSVYDLCKRLEVKNVLIVTNRPAIANSWYEDYCKFVGTEGGYLFVSTVEALKKANKVLNREQYIKYNATLDEPYGCIEFVSLQDLKGSIYFGGKYKKLKEIADINWDILVIDEAHEGIDTTKTDVAFERIKRKYTLHLSGTPFKALANEKFPENAIYNWTYADEQNAKRNWVDVPGTENPYAKLPKLNMYTYQMSEIVKEDIEQGMEVDGEKIAFAFDLNEFFLTKNGKFIHDDAVDHFLDALTKQQKFPFSTDELRGELKHTVWLLNYVESAKCLAKKLEKHPVFKEYKVVLAAGDGRLEEDDDKIKAYNSVVDAISKNDKTITLSVGQLMVGITIPEWSAVLMLSSVKSPALYMQAAFRAQNPCMFSDGHNFYRKENAYIFDFDPARTLIIYDEIANDLAQNTSGGKGDSDARKENIRELLNFFPVIAEDSNGEMIPLDAEKVLSIPRKLKSQEVVKRGFMSDYLFQNISNIFHAPQEVIDIFKKMEPVKEKEGLPLTPQTGDDLSVNDDGDVELTEGYVIGQAGEIFGDKVFDTSAIIDQVEDIVDQTEPSEKNKKEDEYLEQLKKSFKEDVTDVIIGTATEHYGSDLSSKTSKKLTNQINTKTDQALDKLFGDYKVQQNILEMEKEELLEQTSNEEEKEQINQEFKEKSKEVAEELKQKLETTIDTLIETSTQTVVETIETEKLEEKKQSIENSVRDHLRGFSRTIPSFLMAYGNENTTLASFDQIIPEDVFLEVTSITLEQFRFLRDGGIFTNNEGQEEFFKGKLFDPVVFDDSVKEFLAKKDQLANYFDAQQKEDIFDYIPPQKTNQIFTPKWVVKDMVDRLEIENPGCFDDDTKTFADLYMKSGMYVAEIVKRLYQSKEMEKKYPDAKQRLVHIFEKQVFGLAPTSIIYAICLSYILGFDKNLEIKHHNIRLCDSLVYAKEGTLEEKLIEIFGKVSK